jgi:hypothetical protein
MRAVPLLAVLLLASGCIGGSAPAPQDAAPTTSSTPPIAYETIPDVDEERTLERAPKWKMGEWWEIRLTDDFTGATVTTTRVVAGQEGENYLVGMPRDAWENGFMVLHVPGFGEVLRNDLSYEVHDKRFEPLNFPIHEGKTWTTSFEGRKVDAVVTSVEGTRARVWLSGASDQINVTYDAEAGEIVRFEKKNYATYEVVGHGFGHEGIVTVPHMHDVVFMQFRLAGVVGGGPSPFDEVTVDSTYDRVSFVLILGTVIPDFSSPNTIYREKATAPDGTVYEHTLTAADGPGLRVFDYQHDRPGGKWTFEHVALGPGIVGTEGIAYHVYDVVLPEGRILPSTGEHAHGDH